MPRIAGINIPENKNIDISLTYIFGIGRSLALTILRKTKISPQKKAKDLTEQEANELREQIEAKLPIEGELRRQILSNVKRLKDIACYRGLRHNKGLPVRGQRTKTNSRTVRGNTRRTMGSGRKPSAEKT